MQLLFYLFWVWLKKYNERLKVKRRTYKDSVIQGFNYSHSKPEAQYNLATFQVLHATKTFDKSLILGDCNDISMLKI